MQTFSPQHEAQRLETLHRYAVLDTPPEQCFDDLTLIASQICGTPIALMSLVEGERQWFKSKVGIAVEETSRDVSFCAHAISQRKVFVVPDARNDARFRDNPLVTGAPEIRFYAGAPMIAPDGMELGALCVIDSEPRQLTPPQIASLEALSRQAVAQLELRFALIRTNEALERAEDANAALQKSMTTNRALLGALPDLMLRVDTGGIVVNTKSASGSEDSQLSAARIGAHLRDVFPLPIAMRLMNAVQRALADGTLQSLDFPLASSHSLREYEARIIATVQGETMMLLRDITQRKEVERMKSEFVSTVSHELRTPLTSIRGALGLMLGGVAGELPERARSMSQIAYDNSERLIRLINDILDVEKIESGKMELHLAPLDLRESVQAAIATNKSYGEELGVSFTLQIEDEDGEEPGASTRETRNAHSFGGFGVCADADRLAQVLTNLLGNAAKFSSTDGGEKVQVSVKVQRLKEEQQLVPQETHSREKLQLPSSALWLRVSIADEGPGVAEGFRTRLFGKFAQGDSSDTRQKGGTGLGLSISKAIVEKLGGRIGFYNNSEKEKGAKGATFFFELPQIVNEIHRFAP